MSPNAQASGGRFSPPAAVRTNRNHVEFVTDTGRVIIATSIMAAAVP